MTANFSAYTSIIGKQLPSIGGAARKFHPGWYRWASQQSYRALDQPAVLASHLAVIDSIGNNPFIKGVQFFSEWAAFEGATKGSYKFAAFDQLLDRAQQYGKKVMLNITTLHFGNFGSDYSEYFPAYLWNTAGNGPRDMGTSTYVASANGFGSQGSYGLTSLTGYGFSRGITTRIWQPATLQAYNDLIAAYGNRYNGHPAFEMITTGESALNVEFDLNGYSNGALRSAVQSMLGVMRASFPNCQVRFAVNDFGNDIPHMRDILQFCFANQIITGGPDIRRDYVTQADRVYVGYDEYRDAAFEDLRAKMPWIFEIEDPECYLWNISQLVDAADNGYTATRSRVKVHGTDDGKLPDNYTGPFFQMPTLKASYCVVHDQENSSIPGTPLLAQWTRDILPFINARSGRTYYGDPSLTPAYPLFNTNGEVRT